MKKKKLLMLIGSICLSLVLAALLLPACAPAAPEEVAEEIAELEEELAAKDREITGLEGDVGDLEAEIAALKAPVEVIEWRLSSHYSPLELEETQWLTEAIMEASGGRIDIALFGAGVLVPAEENLMAVGEGMVEMSIGYGGYWDDIMPVGAIEAGLPFSWRGRVEDAIFFYETGFLDLIREAYAEHNAYYLAPFIIGRYTLMSTVPFYSLDDMRKLTIRVAGPSADVLTKAGISTTYIPGAELYLALATGVIDAFAWDSPAIYYLLKYYEVCSYLLVEPALVDPINANVFVNMDAWNALPDDLKDIFETSAKSNLTDFGIYYEYGDAVAITKMVTEHGVTVITIPPEDVLELTEASFEVWDDIAARDAIYAAPAVEMLKDFLRTMGH